jgi:hypothetical protein
MTSKAKPQFLRLVPMPIQRALTTVLAVISLSMAYLRHPLSVPSSRLPPSLGANLLMI